jgi:hypothetical protein
MPLTKNDLQMAAWSVITGATDDDILSGGGYRIMAVSVKHTATATLSIDDALTHGGADDILVRCAANDTGFLNLGPGGFRISTGLSTSLSAGSASIFYIADPA